MSEPSVNSKSPLLGDGGSGDKPAAPLPAPPLSLEPPAAVQTPTATRSSLSVTQWGRAAVRAALRFAAARVGERTYERLLAHSVLKENFAADLAALKTFPKREDLWSFALESLGDVKLLYIEFGVREGYSITYFVRRNSHPASVFIGLDSFEGLPEDWGSMPKGTFDVGGVMPKIDDPRVKFIKGWFQNTWDELARSIPADGQLIVHYDADLYSSTLFALTKIDTLKRPYVAIFDEFAGHEARALRNFQQAYKPSIRFVGKTIWNGYPSRVLCRIDGVTKAQA